MTRAELRAVTDRFIDAMNRHDPRALTALYGVDATIESPMFATLRGRAATYDFTGLLVQLGVLRARPAKPA
jgi:hypothetical protein